MISLHLWGGGGLKPASCKGFGDCEVENPCCDWILRKFRSLKVWKFRGITRRLSQSFACARHHEPSNGFDGVVIQPIKSKSLRFIIKQIVSTMTDKLDCHGGQSFARLAMTDWRDFACANFITTLNFQASKLPNFYKSLTAFTMADRLSRTYTLGCKLAFTMAEILISLTIIGVIVAITLPSLVGNINEKTWTAQRKALYSRMSQAISMMPSLNGYGEFQGTWDNNIVTPITDTAAEKFISDGLAKVLKINNICNSTELSKCGIPSKITTMQNAQGKTSKIDFPRKLSDLNPYFTKAYTNQPYWNFANPQKNIDTKVAAFETVNGESVAVFYNPYCLGRDITSTVSNDVESTTYNQMVVNISFPWMCANFVYDFNGKKGPNKVGKDIGTITAMYSTDTLVAAPVPANKNVINNGHTNINQDLAQQACLQHDKESRVPTLEEAIILQFNNKLYNLNASIWTNKVYNDTQAYYVGETGAVRYDPKSSPYEVRCVKQR